MIYDTIIVGAGPAGIFAALELSKVKGLKILILEKGRDVDERVCPVSRSERPCIECQPCHILCGWGGAGAFSDGKLHLNMTGGFLYRNRHRKNEIRKIIEEIDRVYLTYGAPSRIYEPSLERLYELQRRSALCGLRLVPSRIRHMGTEICKEVLRGLRKDLDSKVEVRCHTPVKHILVRKGKAVGVVTSQGKEVYGNHILLAPGREGALWLREETERIGLKVSKNALDMGLRVEVPSKVMAPLTDLLYEPKIIYGGKGHRDKVRTFCVCPYGEVVQEYSGGVTTVNGHSFFYKRTGNTNFAVLVSVETDGGMEPLALGRTIASMVNRVKGGILVQRLGDLRRGKASAERDIKEGKVRPTLSGANPGDISLYIPYRYLKGILEMIDALNAFLPGVGSPDTLLYGMEIKFYSTRIPLKENCETEIENLFGAGDGVGVSRGLIQASVSGVLAARGIMERIGVL